MQPEIDDNICVKFSKYFYNELAEIDSQNNNNIDHKKFTYINTKKQLIIINQMI